MTTNPTAENQWIVHRELLRATGLPTRQLRKRDFLAGFEAGASHERYLQKATRTIESLLDFLQNGDPELVKLFKLTNRDELEILARWARGEDVTGEYAKIKEARNGEA